jgi:hypothetical protein
VAREEVFNKTMKNFTPYFQPFVPLMKKLRRVCFPMGKPWEKEDRKLYSQMKEILREVMDNPDLKGHWKGQGNHEMRAFSLGVREVRAVIYDFQCLVSIAIHLPSGTCRVLKRKRSPRRISRLVGEGRH